MIIGIVIGVVGVLIAPWLLQLLRTPDDVFSMACDYMSISLAGIVSVMLFNVINGILQGVGDAKTPLLILIICSLLNAALDLLFVIAFKMTADGVALATVLAQLLSVLFGVLRINRSQLNIRLSVSKLRMHRGEIRDVVRLGLPTGIQHSLDSIGNLLVQGAINSFGSVIMAANIAVIKLDSFCTMPMMTFATAITVFVGQNVGAKRLDRVHDGVRVATTLSLGLSIVTSLMLVTCGSEMLRLFTQDAVIVSAGMDKIHILAPFYCFMGLWVVFSGVVRGSGESMAPMLIGVLCMFLVRVPLALLLPARIGANGIHWSLALAWAAEAICMMLYYFTVFKKKLTRLSRQSDEAETPAEKAM